MENTFRRNLWGPDPPPWMDASPIPVSLGVTKGPNYLSRSHPDPTWIKYRANPENMVKLTSCSMGEGCTREEKDNFLMWVSLLQPSRSVFCAEALCWNNTWVRGTGKGEPYIWKTEYRPAEVAEHPGAFFQAFKHFSSGVEPYLPNWAGRGEAASPFGNEWYSEWWFHHIYSRTTVEQVLKNIKIQQLLIL